MTIDPAVIDELRVLGGADEQDFLAELIDQFVRETEPLLVELREALEVGRRRHAWAASRTAIKGSCSQLGGRRLALSCGRLEQQGRRPIPVASARTICSRSRSTTRTCAGR